MISDRRNVARKNVRDLDQRAVPHMVPQGVVDGLEPVQIHVDHRHAAPAASGQLQVLLTQVGEATSVVEPREVVDEREASKRGKESMPFDRVAHGAHQE